GAFARDGFPEFHVGDFDGDGRSDIFMKTLENTSVKWKIFHLNTGANFNLLTSIKNGFGAQTDLDYKTIVNGGPSVYENNNVSGDLIQNAKFPLNVVTKLTEPSGKANEVMNVTYKYEGAQIHRKGKGFLGFDKVISFNDISRVRTETIFNLNTEYYEKTPFQSRKFLMPDQGNESLLEMEEYTYSYVPPISTADKSHSVYLTEKTNRNYKTGNNTKLHDVVFDYSNGTLMSQKTSVNSPNRLDYELIEEDNSYHASLTGKWLMDSHTIKTTRYGEVPYSRQTTYDYWPGDALKTVTTDPAFPKKVVTDYIINTDLGLLTQTTVSSPGAAGIHSMVTKIDKYDEKYRFAIRTKNNLDQVSEVQYNPMWGVPIYEKGVDGLVKQYKYDGFGHCLKTLHPNNLSILSRLEWVQTGDVGNEPINVDNALYKLTTTSTDAPTSIVYYDFLGRPVKSETDGFHKTQGMSNKIYSVKEYDSRGNVAKEVKNYDASAFNNDTYIITAYT
ncbi:MAG: toxin TcdB middle/N-terminal domain-containing protein, partial [Flavobacterium sp.]